MNETDHDRWRDELAAYLLGALEPGEAAELERHVAACEVCRTELRWLRPAVQLLPEAVERVEPSPQLRARIVGEVRAEAEGARPSRRRRSLFGSFGWRPIAGLAAVALIVAAVAGYAIRGGEAGGGGTVIAGRGPAGVTAKMVREGDSGTLRLANVGQLPMGKVLEAWVRREGRIVPVRSLFVPDRDGRASTQLPDMHGVDAVMVTAEPRGGSDHPTSTPIVTVAIPQ